MKSSQQNKEALKARAHILRLVQQLMTEGERTHTTFDRVNVDGSNVGATMSVNPSASTGIPDSGGINIYISNNIQGVNNSILVGTEVKMGEPGLKFSLGDRERGKVNLSPKSWLAAIILSVAVFVSILLCWRSVTT